MRLLLLVVTLLFASCGHAELHHKAVHYRVGDTTMDGYVAWDDSFEGKRPGILVVHEWWGLNDYARRRARMLAELGYTALALDMYGNGRSTVHPDQAAAFMKAVSEHANVMRARFNAAMKVLKAQPTVDPNHIAAIGYCFGGGVVLNMARAGADLDAVVSFHGELAPWAKPAQKGLVMAKVLVFNGGADPFTTAQQIADFKQEMQHAGVDYTFVNYPGVKHSFTNPDADAMGAKNNLPLAYDAHADRDSWEKMQGFLRRAFAADKMGQE